MAINSYCMLGEKNPIRSLCSSKTSNLSSCRLIKINFAGKDSCSSSRAHGQNNNKDIKSPYFTTDKVQVLNRVTGKKIINKKPTEFLSSFPLAASVYKANSDEFKLKKRRNNKVKKSVLTLPNKPIPMPKTYTVSDFNDSEYFNATNDRRANKPKKRRAVKRSKKSRVKDCALEFCDRDARYCSQLNIDLDCSSSEIVNFTGDGEGISKLSYKTNKAGNYPHDVWAVLKNIYKFQFSPSPPASQKSIIPLRKRRPIIRKTTNNNDTHFIETCRTEEFSYISSFEIDSKTRDSCSPSSSFDRVTVIDKQSEQDEIVQQFSQNIFGSNRNFGENVKSNINNHIRNKNKARLKKSNKTVPHSVKKIENDHVRETNTYIENRHLEGEKLEKSISNISSVNNTIEHRSDWSSFKENDTISNDQAKNCLKIVRCGDAYVCNNTQYLNKGQHTKVNMIKPIGDSAKKLNGITKVILSKGNETIPPKLSESPRKPRLALTLPNSNIPKLSRFEIKKRLANQKFPIVILGKDQLTNQGIYVANVDLPQFDGLDKHIWPFMLEWTEVKHSENIQDMQNKEIIKTKNAKIKNIDYHRDNVTKNMNDLSMQNTVSKKVECKKKKNIIPFIHNQNPVQLAPEISSHIVQKSKPLVHLKNKMLHFLQKNPSTPNPSENDWSSKQHNAAELNETRVGVSELTQKYNYLNNKCSLVSVRLKEAKNKPIENKFVPKTYSSVRHPWAKGKWASDFIENIIKKIRSGVYYGVDRKENNFTINGTEISTQTEINASKNVSCQKSIDIDLVSNLAIEKDDPLKNIPGFDNALNTLEIETISTNKIAVKHCVTNVVVHFDIQVLGDVKNVTHTKQSMSCIPVHVKDNQEKVFKCNTSIINAILPAELCSIIPTMMNDILEAENKLFLQPAVIQNVQCNPTAVSEFTGPENPQLIINSILPNCAIPEKIRPILNGRFCITNPNYKIVRSTNFSHPTENRDTIPSLFPRLNTQRLCYYNGPPVILQISINRYNTTIEKPNQDINTSNYCMALQPYEPKMFGIVPFLGPFSITDFIKTIIDTFNIKNLTKKVKFIYNDITFHNTNISRTLLMPQDENQNALSLPLSSNGVGIISLFNAFKKSDLLSYNNETDNRILNINDTNVEEKKQKPCMPSGEDKTILRKKGQTVKVSRKKSYVRFYRKCNSMSSISSYKCTPLSRVTNLEEFCQVLGSNLFCNVLDGCLEKKILGAVEEMKNWITDISPKQALLILLLTNKKDTPNLIRFRPVLLQGIAVNRITKADELDTEIEVIEREHFHKLQQYEGISYLSATPKNQDNLLEELYWIAKTTASDYQKTFDESSEKLLKTLLEKRKKLNPSYLRVMARYVGLGLLAPTKL